MSMKEYHVGQQNVHHHPSMRSTTLEMPKSPVQFIDQGDAGYDPMRGGFAMGPSTDFEYSRQGLDEPEETIVAEFQDIIIESAIKADIEYPKIKAFMEALPDFLKKKDKEGDEDKGDEGQDKESYKVDEAVIKEALELGLDFDQVKKILEIIKA